MSWRARDHGGAPAGVKTMEHGSYLDQEAAAAMRETGSLQVKAAAS